MKIDKGCPGERLKTSQVADKGPLGGCALPSGNVTFMYESSRSTSSCLGPIGLDTALSPVAHALSVSETGPRKDPFRGKLNPI